MSIFKRGPNKLEKLRLLGLVDEALGRAEAPHPFADQCRHVRTRSGRTAHLEHPDPQSGVLCGWHAEWVEADLSLPVCRLCEVAAMIADEGEGVMILFRRTPSLRVAARKPYEDPWPEMPPRPSVLNHQVPDPGLRGAWITQVPLRPEFDPCGAGPLASASSKSGAAS